MIPSDFERILPACGDIADRWNMSDDQIERSTRHLLYLRPLMRDLDPTRADLNLIRTELSSLLATLQQCERVLDDRETAESMSAAA